MEKPREITFGFSFHEGMGGTAHCGKTRRHSGSSLPGISRRKSLCDQLCPLRGLFEAGK